MKKTVHRITHYLRISRITDVIYFGENSTILEDLEWEEPPNITSTANTPMLNYLSSSLQGHEKSFA